jgi:hypothetical protein
MAAYGTRKLPSGVNTRLPPGEAPNNALTRDIGMTKLVTASVTFSASTGEVTAASGTFVSFSVRDAIVVLGSAGNDGFYTVLGIDTVAATYLLLSPAPKNGGPETVTIRTP